MLWIEPYVFYLPPSLSQVPNELMAAKELLIAWSDPW